MVGDFWADEIRAALEQQDLAAPATKHRTRVEEITRSALRPSRLFLRVVERVQTLFDIRMAGDVAGDEVVRDWWRQLQTSKDG